MWTLTNTVANTTNLTDSGQHIAFNSKTNTAYIFGSSSEISVIDGKTNNVVKTLPIAAQDLAIDSNTNIIYAITSGKLIIIDGKTNSISAAIIFNVNPPNAGFIDCNGSKISNNYTRYNINTTLQCEAKANNGFTFNAWSGDYLSANLYSPLITLNISKYGSLSADFIQSSIISIPPEFWTPLYGLIPAFFIPSIISWISGKRRETRYLREYMEIIGKADKDVMEKDIRELYKEGKISDSNYKLLKEKIAHYYKDVPQSQGSL